MQLNDHARRRSLTRTETFVHLSEWGRLSQALATAPSADVYLAAGSSARSEMRWFLSRKLFFWAPGLDFKGQIP